MINIGIVVGSTRPGRKADAVARWVYDIAKNWGEALKTMRAKRGSDQTA